MYSIFILCIIIAFHTLYKFIYPLFDGHSAYSFYFWAPLFPARILVPFNRWKLLQIMWWSKVKITKEWCLKVRSIRILHIRKNISNFSYITIVVVFFIKPLLVAFGLFDTGVITTMQAENGKYEMIFI